MSDISTVTNSHIIKERRHSTFSFYLYASSAVCLPRYPSNLLCTTLINSFYLLSLSISLLILYISPFRDHFIDFSNDKNAPWVKQRARPRRNRVSPAMRAMVRESIVTPK